MAWGGCLQRGRHHHKAGPAARAARAGEGAEQEQEHVHVHAALVHLVGGGKCVVSRAGRAAPAGAPRRGGAGRAGEQAREDGKRGESKLGSEKASEEYEQASEGARE